MLGRSIRRASRPTSPICVPCNSRNREERADDPRQGRPPRAGRRSVQDLRRGGRRLGRGRRHGRPRPDDTRPEGADARGREEAAHRAGAALDAVALRSPAPGGRPARLPCAVVQRVHHPDASVRQEQHVQARHVLCGRVGRVRLRQEHSRRREGSSLHRHDVRVGARARARGKTNIWGRLALRLSDYDFKAKTHDGYGEDWPISYADLEPYYDKVDLYLGISGVKENLPHLPDSLFQRPNKLTFGEVKLRESLKKMGRVLTPYRAGVTTDGLKHNRYRSKCYGRGACGRRPGGCDIHAAFASPTGLIYPAMDTGNLTVRPNSIADEILVDPNTGRARGVAFLDSETRKRYDAKARVVIVAASTLESARLLLLSRSRQHPNGLGNSSGHVGHNFCEHVMGPGVTGLVKDLVGKPPTLDDGRPGGFYIPRFRNLKDRQPGFVRGYGFEGGGGFSIFPGHAFGAKGFGAQFKKDVRDHA